MGFGDSVAAQCERVKQEIDAKCYSITWQFFTTVVYKTPVLKGILKNNWYPLQGTSFSSEVNPTSASLEGFGSLSRITNLRGSKEFYGRDGSFTMANNLNYSINAEYLGWPKPQWSGRVKPYRMVALSLAEVAAKNR